jgi:hypothetical protein
MMGICVLGFISDIRVIRDWEIRFIRDIRGTRDSRACRDVRGISNIRDIRDSMPARLSVLLFILRKI